MKHPPNFRAWLAFVHDLCVAALAWASMYYIRYGLEFREPFVADIGRTLVWILPLQGAIFVAFGLYRGLWRFASLLDLQRIVLAAGVGALLIPLGLAGYGIQTALGKMIWTNEVLVVGVPIAIVFYYLAWKHIVRRLNDLLGVG